MSIELGEYPNFLYVGAHDSKLRDVIELLHPARVIFGRASGRRICKRFLHPGLGSQVRIQEAGNEIEIEARTDWMGLSADKERWLRSLGHAPPELLGRSG